MATLQRVYKDQQRELEKQWNIVYGSAITLLWELYGWRKLRIKRFAEVAGEVWKEVAEAGTSESMLEKCEKETGIEMALDGKKSYHEFPYLDHTKWNGRMPTPAQQIYILQQEKLWIPLMLIACFCVALHRKEGWGFNRLTKFCMEIDAVRREQHDPAYFKKLCKERYDIEILLR